MFRDRDALGRDPLPFYLYIDEWQNIITPDIKKILAQARKFGLILILANQDLSQIEEAFSPQFVRTLMTCCKIKACLGGLNRDDAERMAKEMLIGQIDLNQAKYEIWSTKFWPLYQRDYVRTATTFSGKSAGTSAGAASGMSQHYAWIDGQWIPAPATISDTSSFLEASATSGGYAESIADIPILLPVPFSELTGRTTYTRDEQLWRWSDELMEQKQRHCFIKLPGEKTLPLLVPRVETYKVFDATARDYERDIAGLIAAKEPARVDAILQAQQSTSRARPQSPDQPDDKPSPESWDWE